MPRPAHAEMNAAFDDTGRDAGGDDTHIYFDAADTFGRASAEHQHPLLLDDSVSTSTQQQQQQQPQRSSRRTSYDFEQASYFPSAAEAAATAESQPRHSHRTSSSITNAASSSNAGTRSPTLPLHHQRSAGRASTPLERARIALGRFGRYVGMRVPGATYASLQTNDDNDPSGPSGPPGSANRQRPAGLYGGGLNQDGVFGNLSAKPESRNNRRRRRRAADNAGGDGNGDGADNPDDRGSDDDLEDDSLPPTYQAAAADSAPPYWESTILGGAALAGGLYPLAPGGTGWTPGGATVGEVEDLILDGLPIGNFFGFAWNLAVSMCFQFVGFLLTYLLHTTHAAKCGSRAGLGITLIQYGYYLHSRTSEGLNNNTGGTNNGIPDYASDPDTIGNGGLNAAALLFGEGNAGRTAPTATSTAVRLGTGWWGTHEPTARRRWTPEMFAAAGNADDLSGTTTSSSNGPLFFFSAGGGETVSSTSTATSNSNSLTSAALNSTEWFAWFLITVGAFLLLTSIFQYWRFYRWGRALVETARRREREEREANEAATGADAGGASGGGGASGAETGEGETGPVGFLRRLRTVWANNRGHGSRTGSGSHQRSGEDWVVFPGMSAASRRSRREAASGAVSTTNNNTSENVGDGMWWASIGAGTRLGGSGPESDQHRRGGSEEEDEEEEEFGILGPNADSSSHYSPEERRLIRSLRSAGMLG